MMPSDCHPHHEPTRLTVLYIVALSAIALLSLAGELVIQNYLSRQRSDSTVLNIAGRQRMLSQKLTKAALAYVHSTDPRDKQAGLDELRTALALWQRAHEGLQHGDQQWGLPADNSRAI